MKLRYFMVGATVITTIGLAGALAGVGISNLDKPEKIYELKKEIQDTIYSAVPPESRSLPRTGPSLPSPGYEN